MYRQFRNEPDDSIYPARPIRMAFGYLRDPNIKGIVRAVGGALRAELGQPLVADSSAHPSGTLGLAIGARAAADGYTLLVTSAATAWAASYIYNKLPDAPPGDFMPVATRHTQRDRRQARRD